MLFGCGLVVWLAGWSIGCSVGWFVGQLVGFSWFLLVLSMRQVLVPVYPGPGLVGLGWPGLVVWLDWGGWRDVTPAGVFGRLVGWLAG